MAKKRKKASTQGETKFSAEDEMMPHSEAKVALYGSYLEKYLAILGVVEFISRINIFDVFCGTGIYKNGKYGSPIVAHQVINKANKFLKSIGRKGKTNFLIVNDGNSESIEKVSAHLSRLNTESPCCDLSFHNLDAKAMFDKIQTSLKTQGSAERNLIFIDPTGYKEIHRDDLFKLLQSKKSEVVLFLPISFMYRFKEVVQKDFDNPAYVHLRRFINEFFDESHPIRQNEFMSVFTFMKHLAEAFKFNDQFFCTSFSLQRNKNTYYALFFISPHILGLERIIDAKWEIDKQQGKGFIYEEKVGASQLSLFPENTPSAMEERLVELEKLMRSFIEKNPECSNCDLYKFILQNDFRPSHGTQILKKWQAGNLIQVWEKEKNKTAKKNAFYLNYDCYKSTKEVVTYKFL